MSAKRVEYPQGAIADVKSSVAPGRRRLSAFPPQAQDQDPEFRQTPGSLGLALGEECLGRYSSGRSARRRGAPCGSLPAPSPAMLLPVANSLVRSQPEALLREFRQRRREASGRLKAR